MHIKIKKGLDIPIKGKPEGAVKQLVPSGESQVDKPALVALNLREFDDLKFKLLVKAGDTVKIGQPLVEDKSSPGRFFASPAGGTVKEIRRGLKRVLQEIVIETADKEEYVHYSPVEQSRENLLKLFLEAGIFANIRQRPFNILANPTKTPRSIFVKAVETSPFAPPAELEVEGLDKEFQTGLDALQKLTDGKVHLVYRHDSTFAPFTQAQGVVKHTVEGPHPAGNPSVHIHEIDPIRSAADVVWTLNAHDVAAIGYLLMHGNYYVDRIISIAGPGIIEGRRGYYKARAGYPIETLISGRIQKGPNRLISGDVLTGHEVGAEDFLGYYDYTLCVIPDSREREFLHFIRPGLSKYTFSRAYQTGHYDNSKRDYNFTTLKHGEPRPFIDGSQYDKVMPLRVPTMQLVKAVMAEDFELAELYGLLEVAPEDFALPTFVDPSKIEMGSIIHDGLRKHAKDVLQ